MFRFLTLALFFVLTLFSGAVFAYQNQFKTKALFGTMVLGEDVGGKGYAEIETIIASKVSQVELSFVVDKEDFIALPKDAGLDFDVQKSATNAINRGKSGKWYEPWLYASGSLIHKATPEVLAEGAEKYSAENIAIEYTIDKEKLTQFTENLSVRFNTESRNASLVVSGEDVQVVPAIYGRKIVTESIATQIIAGIKQADSPKIKIEFEKVNPEIIEADTNESIQAAHKMLEIPVTLNYQEKIYSPDKKTIGGWVVFTEKEVEGKKKLLPSFSAALVADYFFQINKEISVPAVNRKIVVKNGKDQVVTQEGKDGLAVDYNKASVLVATKLNNSLPVRMDIPTYVVKSKTQINNVIVADWSKYITVNISTQTMCAYLAGGIEQACWKVTTGASKWSTPTGTFLINRKSGANAAGVCMPNPPSPTPLCGINFVSYFTPQGHAIHEAWWRKPGAVNDFGNPYYRSNGSHGCINATYDSAKWIYYWAPLGTPVIIHY